MEDRVWLKIVGVEWVFFFLNNNSDLKCPVLNFFYYITIHSNEITAVQRIATIQHSHESQLQIQALVTKWKTCFYLYKHFLLSFKGVHSFQT